MFVLRHFRFAQPTLISLNAHTVTSIQNGIPVYQLYDLHIFLLTDQEPWPSCAEFDEQGIAYVCVIFYNTTFSATQVSGCVKLNVLVETEIIIPMKCFTLPRPKAIAIDNKRQAAMARK